MAQLPSEHLKRIGAQTVLVVDQGVMSWSASSLNALSRVEIEIVSVSQNNVGINNCTSWNILWLSNTISFILSKKPSVMHLIHRDNSETRSEKIYLVNAYNFKKNLLVFSWKLFECILNCSNFNFSNSLNLAFGSSETVHNDLSRFYLNKKKINFQ